MYRPFFVFCLILLTSQISYARPSGVSVAASSQGGLSFAVTVSPDLKDLRRLYDNDSTYCFVKTVPVVVPSGGNASLVSATGLEPVAVQGWEASQLQSARTMPLADISKPFVVRGRTLVTVRVYPVHGNEVYSRVELQIGFQISGARATTAAESDPVFDRIFARSVANFEEASSWPVVARPSAAASLTSQDSPFAHSSSWIKIGVTETGLHRITGADLESAGASLTGVSSSAIRIFSGGGQPLPFQNSTARPEFQEISILVLDGGDGRFDRADQIVWFGEAPDRWLYNATGYPQYLTNIYCHQNVYWLTGSGSFSTAARRIESVDASVTGSADTTVTTARRFVHLEQDKVLEQDADAHVNDYYTWYWTDATSLNMTLPTPGAVSGETAAIRLVGHTGAVSPSERYMTVTINGASGTGGVCSSTACTYATTALVDGSNSCSVDLTPQSGSVAPYFNYLDCSYRSRLQPLSNTIDIYVDSMQRRAAVQVTDNFSGTPIVLSLADPRHPSQLTGWTRSSGLLTFEYALRSDSVNRFYGAQVATALSPTSIAARSVSDLRVVAPQTDLIIVAPQAFVSSLAPYVSIIEGRGRTVRIVTVESIMDNFAFGQYDPTAIRDFLKYAYEYYPTPAPSAVLFVGDANYDYLDRLNTGMENYVPSYINPVEGAYLGSSYSDDNYVYFGDYGVLDSDRSFLRGDRGYDMMTARWPVRSTSEIRTIIDKIRGYESPDDFGSWRTGVTLIADDEFGAFNSEIFHVTQTEELEKNYLPRDFTRQKIYLWEYPFVNSYKPAVNEAIIDAFNEGALVVNYVGHGNPDVWAHERVFTRTGDLPKLTNLDRLPLVYAASCAIGFFDDPRRQAMGEDFLTLSTGGAIGTIAAMRLVFSADNAAFNRQVYDILMRSDSLTIGEAFYAAKLLRQYGSDTIPHSEDNDRAYLYFGDPMLTLGVPHLRLSFAQAPDSLQALGTHHVEGNVTDEHGAVIHRNGTLAITVFDSDRQKSHQLVNSSGQVTQTVDYTVSGPSIFRGSAAVSDGHFSFDFVVPLDVGIGGQGARIMAYAVLDTIDAVLLRDSLPISSMVAVRADSVGPTIACTVGERKNFASGDVVQAGEDLKITISDSSGVNLAGGLGHGITMEIDGETANTVNLTSLFQYDRGSYVTGSLSYSLSVLNNGQHRILLRAWDNANNVTSEEISVNVESGGVMAINKLLNYPNPMNDATTFYFELTQAATSVTVEVFTLSGRRIWSVNGRDLRADNYPNGDFKAVWNGRDVSGARVATGVYIFKATVLPQTGGSPVESFGKVVVVN